MAEALSQDHSLVAVYCDEDLMDKRGRRSKPLLKPAWSPPLADSGWLSLEGALIRPSAAFPRFEISDAGIEQLLNAACSRREVLHIPQILLHRAQERPPVPNSKPLQRSTTKPCSVSVIIPTRDHVQLLRVCVNSIPKCASDISTDLIILNNGSSEPCTWQYFEEIKSERAVDVVDAFAPFNFSQLCNLGVRRSPNEHVLLMNNDVEARDTTWLSTMVAELDDPDVGAVGALLVYPDGYIQHGGITLGLGGAVARNSYQFQHPRSRIGRGLLKQRRDVSAVTAACLLTRKSLWDLVGGMDEENLAVAYNDVDYCLKLRQMGKRIVWTPHAVLVHRESVSRGPDRSEEAFRRFVKEETVMRERWGNLLKQDPYYNPNLSLTVEASMLEPFPISLAARRS
jgi:GT2 family glycosyltransferase